MLMYRQKVISKKLEKKIIFCLGLEGITDKRFRIRLPILIFSSVISGPDPDPYQNVTDPEPLVSGPEPFPYQNVVPKCRGSGTVSQRSGAASVPKCHGSGFVSQRPGAGSVPKCHGSGTLRIVTVV